MRIIKLEGRLFGMRVPQHTNLGCLAMLFGTIFALITNTAFSLAMISWGLDEDNPYYPGAALLVTSFATGLLVGGICREKRHLYAVLTVLLFPFLISIRLLFYQLAESLGRGFTCPFLIAMILCPIVAYVGATARGSRSSCEGKCPTTER